MKRYELTMKILNDKYIDQTIVSLVRQGYCVYLRDEMNEKSIFFEVQDDDLQELKE